VLQELPLIPIIHRTLTYAKTPELSGENWLNRGLVGLQWLEKSPIDKQQRHGVSFQT